MKEAMLDEIVGDDTTQEVLDVPLRDPQLHIVDDKQKDIEKVRKRYEALTAGIKSEDYRPFGGGDACYAHQFANL